MNKKQASWRQQRWTYEDSLGACRRGTWLTGATSLYATFRALTTRESLHGIYWLAAGLLLGLALIWGFGLPALLRRRIARRDRDDG